MTLSSNLRSVGFTKGKNYLSIPRSCLSPFSAGVVVRKKSEGRFRARSNVSDSNQRRPLQRIHSFLLLISCRIVSPPALRAQTTSRRAHACSVIRDTCAKRKHEHISDQRCKAVEHEDVQDRSWQTRGKRQRSTFRDTATPEKEINRA